MPTFRNDGERAVIYTEPDGKNIIIFDPGKNVQLVHWIPYMRLGLTLVNESYPPVPDTVLISGLFKFNAGMERKYSIESCAAYLLDVVVEKGALKLYAGSSQTGIEMYSSSEVPYRYRAKYCWEYAPYVRVVGLEDGTEALIHAEAVRGD